MVAINRVLLNTVQGSPVIIEEQGDRLSRLQRVSAKAAFSRATRKRLIHSRAQLDGVNAAIRLAVASGQLCPGAGVEKMREAMELKLAAAERSLEQLQKSGDDRWETLRESVDGSCQELSNSISMAIEQVAAETRRLAR